jgi:CIC family chloride channel protein
LPITALTDGIEFVSMWRWVQRSLVVGVLVGLAAAGLHYALEEFGHYLLGGVAGEHGPATQSGDRVVWLIVALPAAGGLAVGFLTAFLSPEARGAGTNAVIDDFHNGDGYVRTRVPIVKSLATLVTLGTGGSGGREGPMAQIGAGIASWAGRLLRLSVRERRLLLLAGAAGGISALFRAPLGASIWALEVIYKEDFESEGMFPCLVSSVTAYSVSSLIFGQGSLFSVPGGYDFHPLQLGFYAVLGLGLAPFAVLWIKLTELGEIRLWAAVPLPVWAKPALGGLLLGGLCLAVPEVFGTGYGWMQDALKPLEDPTRVLPVEAMGFGILLGLAVAKMVATSLTISSGGSAGTFAPSLFIGGFIGAGFGLLFHAWAPSIAKDPGAFALVGMGAFYAGIARAPIATIILISELFGSYDLLVPLMFTEMITLVLLRRYSLYPAQVEHAYDSPAHEADFTVDVLGDLRVGDYYTPGRAAEPIPASMTISAFLEHVSKAADSFFVVHDRDGKLVGTVSLSNVREVVTESAFLEAAVVGDAMWPLKAVSPSLDLKAALDLFLQSGYDHLPVVAPTDPQKVLGMLSQQQIFAAYNAEILRRRLDDEELDADTLAG